jgi:hypothetical protein
MIYGYLSLSLSEINREDKVKVLDCNENLPKKFRNDLWDEDSKISINN